MSSEVLQDLADVLGGVLIVAPRGAVRRLLQGRPDASCGEVPGLTVETTRIGEVLEPLGCGPRRDLVGLVGEVLS